MKHLLFLIIALFCSPSIFAQSFETDRFPIGDAERKYTFCAIPLNKIYDTTLSQVITFEKMIEDLKQVRIVLIGESHTNQFHHDLQYEIIQGLVEAGKPVVLALEMYTPKQNEALAVWSSGKTDPETFLEQTDYLSTWGHNYRYYKSIFDYAREKQIPMYGVNVEREYASKIGKGGLESLSEEEFNAIPDIDTSTIEHRFLINTMMQGMAATMPKQFNYMYQAQSLWDAAMGEGAIEAANKHPEATVIVLAGSGHVVYNLGIGRIIKQRSKLSFASVVPVDIPEKVEETGMMKVKKDVKSTGKDSIAIKEKAVHPSAHAMGMASMSKDPYRIVVRSYGDYLWGQAEMKQEKYPAFGFSLAENHEGFEIKRVLPQTIAYENGLRIGDKILTIDGRSFRTKTDVKKYMQYKNWNEEISFFIQRKEQKLTISFMITPVKK